MREVKFRARWKDTGKVIPDFNEEYSIDHINDPALLVDQFTGLTDRTGLEIYEGDIVQEYTMMDLFQVVFTDYANFGLKPVSSKAADHLKGYEYSTIDPSYASTSLTVVGNIHSNPELTQ